MYIDIVLKELDELEKRKDRISSNNYLNQCNKLKKKYDLYKTIDDNTTYLIDQINNNSMIINGTYYSGKGLPPQLNTPSALKPEKKKKIF